MIAVFKMKCLKGRIKLNYFVLRSKRYLKTIRFAFDELQASKAGDAA
jgi:hypothetical protein